MLRTNSIKKYLVAGCLAGTLLMANGCKKGYFDTVPDNITTLDAIFTNKNMSEQWLARVYNAIPDMWDQPYGAASQWSGLSDEIEYSWFALPMNNGAHVSTNGTGDGLWKSYYQGIRYASVFLKNIDQNKELLDAANGAQLMKEYKGEARFLRAYYYWSLMRIFGPVVLMGEEPGEVTTEYQTPRSTWAECVEYVLSEMEKAKLEVPEVHYLPNSSTELDKQALGRITKGVIMAVQSQVLLYDASPLYNGNTEMGDFKNMDGKQLFSQTYDANKWKRAADAAKAIINLNKWQLYKVSNADPFMAAYLSCRNLYWDGWRTEGIWMRPASNYQYQWEQHCAPRNTQGNAWNGIGVFQELVDDFRMENGMPISGGAAAGYTEQGFTMGKTGFYVNNTSNMYAGREPRFYMNITFNGSTLPTVAKTGETYVGFFYTGNSGKQAAPRDWPKTGYTARKNIHPSTNFNPAATVARPAMMIRLAEIYLNYAEAMNEFSPGSADALTYLNLVRERGGLAPLAAGLSQSQLRKEIHLERRIELSFEGHRYFDVRRWKVAGTTEYKQGGALHGMNMDKGSSLTDPTYYQRTAVVNRSPWERRNYFWPLPQSEMDRNKQLVQPPGY